MSDKLQLVVDLRYTSIKSLARHDDKLKLIGHNTIKEEENKGKYEKP